MRVLPAGCLLLCFFFVQSQYFFDKHFHFFSAPHLILPYSRLPRLHRPGAILPPCRHHPHAHGSLYSDQPEEQEEIRKRVDVVQRKSPVKHHPQSVLGASK